MDHVLVKDLRPVPAVCVIRGLCALLWRRVMRTRSVPMIGDRGWRHKRRELEPALAVRRDIIAMSTRRSPSR